jgi:hypothetical protein
MRFVNMVIQPKQLFVMPQPSGATYFLGGPGRMAQEAFNPRTNIDQVTPNSVAAKRIDQVVVGWKRFPFICSKLSLKSSARAKSLGKGPDQISLKLRCLMTWEYPHMTVTVRTMYYGHLTV